MSAYAGTNVLFLISRPEALEGRPPSTWVRTIILAASLCGSAAPTTFGRPSPASSSHLPKPVNAIIVIKLDELDLSEWWNQFLYATWDSFDQPGSVIRLVESLLGHKIFPGITGA
jgi:hypothetical protein